MSNSPRFQRLCPYKTLESRIDHRKTFTKRPNVKPFELPQVEEIKSPTTIKSDQESEAETEVKRFDLKLEFMLQKIYDLDAMNK